MHTTIIEVDSQQFIDNLLAIRQYIDKTNPQIKFCLPVKANAYGHGLIGISQLAEPYIDYLAVACLDEGEILRQNGITKPILVFGAFSEDQIPGFIANDLEITISSVFKAVQVAEYCKSHKQTAKIHLKIDTGMNRVGVRVETAPELFKYVATRPELNLLGVYSHLASADEDDSTFTLTQINRFEQVANLARQYNPQIICHLANSAGLCYYPTSYFDMVRPGIFSFGYFPNKVIEESPLNQVKPCFSLKSQITYTKLVEAGQTISYNHRYTINLTSRVVTIPIGYGDGYRRSLSNLGEVLIRNQSYTISGTICMDMFMVDLGPNGIGYVGDEVILIGHQGIQEITLESVAEKCNTVIYEILCGFNQRIPRVYTP